LFFCLFLSVSLEISSCYSFNKLNKFCNSSSVSSLKIPLTFYTFVSSSEESLDLLKSFFVIVDSIYSLHAIVNNVCAFPTIRFGNMSGYFFYSPFYIKLKHKLIHFA